MFHWQPAQRGSRQRHINIASPGMFPQHGQVFRHRLHVSANERPAKERAGPSRA